VIIVDRALEQRELEGRPLRVAVVGAGFMGRRIAQQIELAVPGMRLAAVASRRLEDVERAFAEAGRADVEVVAGQDGVERAVGLGRAAASTDPVGVAGAEGIDVVIEATGDVECGARVAVTAIEAGTHVVLVNADADATVGPALAARAASAGVVITGVDGDEPAVAMNLVRYVRAIGYRPLLAGNIKGFVDPYRTPETQKAFAESVGQRPRMITSFADGTKLSMEATILGNATGLGVARRGMVGYRCAHVRELLELVSADELLPDGRVDYTLGAEPGSGAFVVGYGETPDGGSYMRYFKMGDGPLYLLYQPYHLPHVEAPLTAARAALFADAAVRALGEPVCETIACAKRDLEAGETLDGVGGFTCYGLVDSAATTAAEELLPIGLAHGCRLLVDVPRDRPLRRSDVEVPAGRLCDELHAEQRAFVTRPAVSR
jgi:predicted homoserine dehydrogenase-like protein